MRFLWTRIPEPGYYQGYRIETYSILEIKKGCIILNNDLISGE